MEKEIQPKESEKEEQLIDDLKKSEPELLAEQVCPFCHNKDLTLMEQQVEVPFFGKLFLFSMTCSNCKYHKADIEATEPKEPCKYTFEVSSEDDMNVRIVRSSAGKIKIPHVMDLRPGPAANGFITNVEGLINRVKTQVERLRDEEEDPKLKKKAKNLLKKLLNVTWGKEKIKIIIEDPTGNSAIISDRAVKEKLKVK